MDCKPFIQTRTKRVCGVPFLCVIISNQIPGREAFSEVVFWLGEVIENMLFFLLLIPIDGSPFCCLWKLGKGIKPKRETTISREVLCFILCVSRDLSQECNLRHGGHRSQFIAILRFLCFSCRNKINLNTTNEHFLLHRSGISSKATKLPLSLETFVWNK